MASVNVCRCPGGISAQREPILNVKQEHCGDIRITDSCRPAPVPNPCKSIEKPQTFGLNLNLQSMTGQDYSSSTGCQLVRSANIIEWDQMNDRKVFGARSDKENSEMLRELSKRQQDECLTTCRHRAADTTKKLGERLRDTNYWKFELERLLEDMRNEIDLLIAQKNRLRNSLNASQIPYMIVTDSLDTRRRRIDGDLVTDQLDVALMKEMDVIKRARDLMEDTSVTADRVLAGDRRAKDALEHDWSDKYEASRIDSAAGELTPNSTNIKPYPGVRAFHPGWRLSVTAYGCHILKPRLVTYTRLSQLETAWRNHSLVSACQEELSQCHRSAERYQLSEAAHLWLYSDLPGTACAGRDLVLDQLSRAISAANRCPPLWDLSEEFSQLSQSVEQRLRWAAGANAEVTQAEGPRAEPAAEDSRFIQLLGEVQEAARLSAELGQTVTPVEQALALAVAPTDRMSPAWITKAAATLQELQQTTQEEISERQSELFVCWDDIRSHGIRVRDLLTSHHKLISDVRLLLKAIAKSPLVGLASLLDQLSLCIQLSVVS
ncbi:tektin-4-like [Pollicipes pollicipes]|uniref:tektin-4-like n=1 Tax=Pollicipes pollicipes TaxID=41117 RepID=UPI00188579B8|nr:tektin-4-like [Pollicipes pollicipes]